MTVDFGCDDSKNTGFKDYSTCACSVMSDFLWPHGLQPARLLCSWPSPGKNAGVDCHFLPQGIFLTQGSVCISCIGRWFFTTVITWETFTFYRASGKCDTWQLLLCCRRRHRVGGEWCVPRSRQAWNRSPSGVEQMHRRVRIQSRSTAN